MDEVDRNVPGSHLIRQPTAATFPSRGRLDTQQIVHSCDFVQSHKFPFLFEKFYETNVTQTVSHTAPLLVLANKIKTPPTHAVPESVSLLQA